MMLLVVSDPMFSNAVVCVLSRGRYQRELILAYVVASWDI